MNTRKLTKLAGTGLSGLLIASFIVMSAGLLFVLAPASPVSADNGLVVTRHLPDTVVPGETFEVTVTFTAPEDDFKTLGFHDEAPGIPSDWLIEADVSWCNPVAFTAVGDKTDNVAEYTWMGPFDSGTDFTAIYQVTVPDNAPPDTYTFPVDDDTEAWLTYYIGTDSYRVPITGDYQVEITKPDEVWVNDDWAGLDPGDPINGLTFGYNAFATIQDGIDGVADSTVHVLEGDYKGFVVDGRSNLTIIGYDAVVTGLGPIHPDIDVYAMAMVAHSENIAIQNLDFIYAPPELDVEPDIYVGPEAGIVYIDSTGSISGVYVTGADVTIFGDADPDLIAPTMQWGILVERGIPMTVNISDTTVEGCPIGVEVDNDHVNLTRCTIKAGVDQYGGVGILARNGAVVNIDDCEISGFHTHGIPAGEALDADTAGLDGVPYDGTGILVDAVLLAKASEGEFDTLNMGSSQVTVTGCSQILNNDFGIYVGGGYVEVTGCGIEGNHIFGVYNEDAGNFTASSTNGQVNAKANWWGDPSGPFHPEDNPDGQGDEVSDNVVYFPWLDAPCPGGKPVAPFADFVGEPREGTAPLTVQFTDLSEGTGGSDILSWLWEFGDGTTSDEQHPTHTYTAVGTYTVTLKVIDGYDQESEPETKHGYITVVAEPDDECLIDDEPDPAKLVASNMLVSPGQVHPNQQIEISINIGNTGGTAGTHEVNLYINGHFEDNQTVTVPAGSTQLVVFTVTRADPGTYYVSVDGHEGQFSVVGDAPTHWGGPLGTGGIIAIIVVVIALVLGLVLIFRRQ